MLSNQGRHYAGRVATFPLAQSASGSCTATDVPEQTQRVIEIRTLLNPQLKIGQLVKLDSTAINLLRFGLDNNSQQTNAALKTQIKTNADGLYYVMTAKHSGEWYTDIVCLAVDATFTGSNAPTTVLPEGAVARN